MEVLDVVRERRNVSIVRGDDNQRPPNVLPQAGNEESTRGACETRHHDIGVALQGFGSDAAEIRRGGDSGENLRYAFIENFHDPERAPKPARSRLSWTGPAQAGGRQLFHPNLRLLYCRRCCPPSRRPSRECPAGHQEWFPAVCLR